jgi:anti-sigma regulatory factor (Ser/Thr protein kinase)
MNTGQPPEPGPSTTVLFRHEAMFYDGPEQFVAGAAGFIRDSIDADEPILVAVIAPRRALLREEFGPDAKQVRFLDMEEVGRNPARIIPAWRDWVAEHAPSGRGFRGVGEPIWDGRTSAEIVECQQHEQLLNTAFDGGPGWSLLCPYDTASLPADVLDRARHTHPAVVRAGVRTKSDSYPSAELNHAAMLAEPLPAPPDSQYRTGFGLADLARIRGLVAAHANAAGVAARRIDDLVLVANELACNSIRHGGGTGTLRLWRDSGELICEVHDGGLVTDPLIGRRSPDPHADGGAGLWIANQVCDLVQIRSTPQDGTTVRVHIAASTG